RLSLSIWVHLCARDLRAATTAGASACAWVPRSTLADAKLLLVGIARGRRGRAGARARVPYISVIGACRLSPGIRAGDNVGATGTVSNGNSQAELTVILVGNGGALRRIVQGHSQAQGAAVRIGHIITI